MVVTLWREGHGQRGGERSLQGGCDGVGRRGAGAGGGDFFVRGGDGDGPRDARALHPD